MRQFEGESPDWTEAYLEAAASATVLVDTSMSINESAEASAAYCEAYADATVARLQARREAREKAETERREAEKARLQKSWIMYRSQLWRIVSYHASYRGGRAELVSFDGGQVHYCDIVDVADMFEVVTEDQCCGIVASQLFCGNRTRDCVVLVWDVSDEAVTTSPPHICDVLVDGQRITEDQWAILLRSGLVPVYSWAIASQSWVPSSERGQP